MVLDKETALETAERLLQINAIKLRPENPFTWASGWKSPIYCDNRIILSHPEIRKYVAEKMAAQIKELFGEPEVIAGVATGAIGIGMLVAEVMGLPFVYVRPEPKAHGRQNQIEGHLASGQSVVVVEDLISTGKSSLNAVAALRKGGADVLGMIGIFSYAFPVSEENFQGNQLKVYTLGSYPYLIELALEKGAIDKNQLDTLKQWRKSPSTWNN